MSAEQMRRDGIRKLPAWGKGMRIGCATYRAKLVKPDCEHPSCSKSAGYETPFGVRCFTHARLTNTALEGDQ